MSLIQVKVEEPLVKATIQFWDPSCKCFTFNEEDLTPTVEEYSILLRMELQCLDKVYVWKPKLGTRKKLAKIMGVKVEIVYPHVRYNGENIGVK